MRRHGPLALALLLDVVGAGGALLLSLRTWQQLSAGRERPFRDVTVGMTGRDVDAAITALGLVALAGLVAVLATKGRWRRVVGAVVGLAGAGLVVRALLALSAVDAGRARSFIEARRQTVSVPATVVPHVETSGVWPVLTAVCGLLVLAAGALVAVRGGRWEGMSARYETPPPAAPDGAADSTRAAAAMWTALDRGEDPTAR